MYDDRVEVREKNLKKLIKESYKDDYDRVAGILDKSKQTVQKYCQPKAKLQLTPSVARKIEEALHLPKFFLDQENDTGKSIYYVMIFVKDSETYHIVEWLYHNAPEVKDCSSVLGEFDVLLKIEVPSFHYLEMFFSKLKRIPNVMRTQTFASVDSLRWQREQDAYTHLKNPLEEKNFLQKYKQKRVEDLNRKMRDIEDGIIVAYEENSEEKISLLEIMKATRNSFYSVKEYQEKIDSFNEYCHEEKIKIKQGLELKRIFTLPTLDFLEKEEVKKIMSYAKSIIDVNLNADVRFVFEENWICKGDRKGPECFAIVDNEFLYARGDSKTKAVLKEKEHEIYAYKELFNMNWDVGMTYNEFERRYANREYGTDNLREYLP